jgi:ribosome-binding protein aMBF1 (putative translation factor)
MIKNERQYRITKAQADKFEGAIAEARAARTSGIHPVLQKAQVDGMRSQLADLRRDLSEYEALRSGACRTIKMRKLEDLPKSLIQARIAAGLSQEELAGRLGLKPQQIQRYEATDYRAASLERINEVVRVLGIKLTRNIELRLVS